MDPETRAEIEALKTEHLRLATELIELKLSRRQKVIRAMRRNKRAVVILTLIVTIIPAAVYALSITKTFTFNAGSPTVAAEVNTNFDQLFTKVNDLAAYHPPIGSILAWHKSFTGTPSLPVSGEWVECNGQTLSDGASPYNGQVIPNLNGDATGANSPGQSAKIAMFLRGGLTSGTGQQDAFQGHWHSTNANVGTVGTLLAAGSSFTFATSTLTDPITDTVNGTPRTASETRPVNMSVVWIMKVK